MTTTCQSPEYLTAAETAKTVRQALKTEFKHIRFSIRSKTYAGGASITVAWTDGPTEDEVQQVTRQFESSDFDPTIDLKVERAHFLLPDGSTIIAETPGSTGQKGLISPVNNRDKLTHLPEGTRLVRFGANYINHNRSMSDFKSKQAQALQWVYDNCHIQNPSGNPHRDRWEQGGLLIHLVNSLTWNRRMDEPLSDTFRRTRGIMSAP